VSAGTPAIDIELALGRDGERAHRRERLRRIAAGIGCLLVGAVYLLPLLWVASLSVRSEEDVTSFDIVPRSFEASNYSKAWREYALGTLFAHSIFVTIGTVLLSVAMSVLAAYGFARWRSRLTEGMFLLILLGLMVPPATMIVPFFLVMQNLGLYNNLFAVVLGEAAFALPLGILILRGYVDRIPFELTDAARVDGATPIRAFVHVVLPLLKAPIITVALFITLFTWNDFLIPLVLLPNPQQSTLTVGLAQSVGQFGQLQLGLISAASVMALLPILAVFFAARRYYVQGLSAGALKQ
jgi:ABC-type glycerol-3-phosphate transport system permease component